MKNIVYGTAIAEVSHSLRYRLPDMEYHHVQRRLPSELRIDQDLSPVVSTLLQQNVIWS